MKQSSLLCVPQFISFHDLTCFLSLSLFSWSLSGSEQFALRYADGPQLYITEQVSFSVLLCCWTANQRWFVNYLRSLFISQSRGEIKNGTILRLAISPVSILFIPVFFCLFYILPMIRYDFTTHKHLSFTLPSVFSACSCHKLFVSRNFLLKASSSLLDRRALLWKGWKKVDSPQLIPASNT